MYEDKNLIDKINNNDCLKKSFSAIVFSST